MFGGDSVWQHAYCLCLRADLKWQGTQVSNQGQEGRQNKLTVHALVQILAATHDQTVFHTIISKTRCCATLALYALSI